jgi:hypothetical protein
MPLAKLLVVFLAAHVATALYFFFDRAPGTAAAFAGLPLDDAWSHMVYARSLAAFHGFAYNPGQLETGSTSPLWAVTLVPATWLARLAHISVAIPAKITSLLAAVGASLAAARLVRGLGFGRSVELAAGLAMAADPALAFAQVSGMEVMLAAGLALWALGELAHGRHFVAGIAAGLAPLARPEMALLTALVLALAEWRLYQHRASLKARLAVALPTVVLVGSWMAYCLAVSGYPLPSTFYAKFASREDYLVHNLVLISTEVLPASPWLSYGTGVFLWGLGAYVLWQREAIGRATVVFPLTYWVAVSASQLLQAAWPFFFLRYLLPAQVFMVVTVAVGGASAVSWVWHRRSTAFAPVRAIGVGLLLVGSLAKLPSAFAEQADRFAWNCQNIEELNVAMAVWLRENVPQTEIIAVNDAGASRYFGGHEIFDMAGLNHHAFLHRDSRAMAALARIGFVAAFPSLIPHVSTSPDWIPIHRTSTEHLTICRCSQSEIVAYRRVSGGQETGSYSR